MMRTYISVSPSRFSALAFSIYITFLVLPLKFVARIKRTSTRATSFLMVPRTKTFSRFKFSFGKLEMWPTRRTTKLSEMVHSFPLFT